MRGALLGVSPIFGGAIHDAECPSFFLLGSNVVGFRHHSHDTYRLGGEKAVICRQENPLRDHPAFKHLIDYGACNPVQEVLSHLRIFLQRCDGLLFHFFFLSSRRLLFFLCQLLAT